MLKIVWIKKLSEDALGAFWPLRDKQLRYKFRQTVVQDLRKNRKALVEFSGKTYHASDVIEGLLLEIEMLEAEAEERERAFKSELANKTSGTYG
jgi:hypothetical protein